MTHNGRKTWCLFIATSVFCQGEVHNIVAGRLRCGYCGDQFGSLEDVGMLEVANLSLDEPELEVVVFTDDGDVEGINSEVEGPKSPEEMLAILQRVLEESSPVLVSARLEAEERRNNMRLREEQDAAYRAALEADKVSLSIRIGSTRGKKSKSGWQGKLLKLRASRKEEEEARERATREAAEKEATLARMRQEKTLSLGVEPEKAPDVTQVLVRFPTGESKGRRFHSMATIQSLYDYVDSIGCLEVESYSLVSNFPRVVYGPEKLSLSLEDAGLHPQASLFVEVNS
ncbi:UBX domain-containing protein [Actinidia rufa]|uniref:UBX domain-containing protein n=1 Tax=Actinidia rufa TaxID=165716 RepID=A0A7J0DQT8_9ERIC|nr:UBX domain-containing protein [Actinidia rufa]